MRLFWWTIMAMATTATTTGFGVVEAAPTGASLFWTSNDPAVREARDLALKGKLSEADTVLTESSAPGTAEDAQARAEGREILRRIRIEYDQEPAELLKKLQQKLPDLTTADLEYWRQIGQAQARVLDDKLWYFGREPSNIWLFCDDAKTRLAKREGRDPRALPATSAKEEGLIKHIEEVIAAAEPTGKDQVVPYKITVRYKLTVKPDRPGAKAGSVVRCWLPFPQEYRQQKEVRLLRTSPAEHTLAPTAVDTWPIGGAPQRTVYFERKIEDAAQPLVFEVDFEFVSCAFYPNLDESKARHQGHSFPAEYLVDRPTHIVFTPQIRAKVAEIVGPLNNPLAKARAIFRWICANHRWCAEQEYSVLPNASEKLFLAGRGDCGTHALLFITMCRLADVPARWQSGWETAPGGYNMHDWAEFYVAPWGWLPADTSYGFKDSDNPKVREFYCGHQDAFRLIVNLDYGCPLQPAKKDLRSEPLDFQRGEVEIDGRNLYFDEWSYKFDFDQAPVRQ
ncbi:MAG: transglutaminase family protein [Phycisphaerae bacterium]|nr:transglutaminase family protein [Phycisphaerae bacterium]